MSDERYIHDARRREAEAEQFKSATEDAALGESPIDEHGRMRRHDADEGLFKKRDTARTGPPRPIDRIEHKPDPGWKQHRKRGTQGWRHGKGEIHPRHRKYRVHSAKGGRVPGDVDPWVVDVDFREDRDAWAIGTVARLLGEERVARLAASFQRGPGPPSNVEKADRVYLAMVLAGWGPWADEPVARLLGANLRRVTDLRQARQANRDGAKERDLAAAWRELQQRRRELSEN